jgi:hypothetical protein
MNYLNKTFSFVASVVFFVLVTGLCNCVRRNECIKSPNLETSGIVFRLKDKITGNDILTNTGTVAPVPDSIKLKNIRTGLFYQLITSKGPNGVYVYSNQYKRPAGVTDSLVFLFGNAVPDTLVIYTGLIDGWRGDECPTVKDAGIIKVTLSNQILYQATTPFDNAEFILQK